MIESSQMVLSLSKVFTTTMTGLAFIWMIEVPKPLQTTNWMGFMRPTTKWSYWMSMMSLLQPLFHKHGYSSCNLIQCKWIKEWQKRGAIFNWLRSKGSDIIFLQETHCHLRKERYKRGKEWNGKSLWSMGTSHSKGVTILFKEKWISKSLNKWLMQMDGMLLLN